MQNTEGSEMGIPTGMRRCYLGEGRTILRAESRLTYEQIRRLDRLKHLYPDPYDCASAIIEDCEAHAKPMDAIATAEELAWEIHSASGEDFWESVEEAIETVRDEDEDEATIWYSDGGPVGDPEAPHGIGCFHDDTEGDFVVKWIPTDPWRGYYAVEPSAESNWVELHDDCILGYSKDAEDLASMDGLLRDYMDAHEIPYARAFARSSNAFSVGYTLFVPNEHVDELVGFVANLKAKYRDDFRFAYTAIFGTDSGAVDQ